MSLIRKAYPSDVSDDEWALVAPYLTLVREDAGQREHRLLGMVAQMERRFIKERQREGIARAKLEGAYTGGKRRLDRERVRTLHGEGQGPAAIASALGC